MTMKTAIHNQDLLETDFEEDNNLSSSKALLDLSAFEEYLSLKRILLAIAILLFLIAWNRGVALLYAMDALVVATLITAWIIPKFNIRNIEVDLFLPEKAYEGEHIPLLINTNKTGLFNRYMIECWVDFAFLGSNKQSMMLIHKISQPAQHTINLPCDCRGHYTINSFTLQTGFPLGLISSNQHRTLSQPSSILIYPTPIDINQFELAKDQSHSAMQQDINPKAGGHDEYIGIREYRHGDSPRHIHWPSSAKRGELVVREFQQNSTTHLNIVLDLNPAANFGKGKHSTLEYSIKITATLIQYALEHHYSFSVYGLGEEPFEINNKSGSQSVSSLNNALEALAWVKANGNYSYTQAIRQHMANNRRGGTLVLFDCMNTNQIGSLLPELQAQHAYPLIYKFDSNSFNGLDNQNHQQAQNNHPQKNESNLMTIWQISRGCDLRMLFV